MLLYLVEPVLWAIDVLHTLPSKFYLSRLEVFSHSTVRFLNTFRNLSKILYKSSTPLLYADTKSSSSSLYRGMQTKLLAETHSSSSAIQPTNSYWSNSTLKKYWAHQFEFSKLNKVKPGAFNCHPFPIHLFLDSINHPIHYSPQSLQTIYTISLLSFSGSNLYLTTSLIQTFSSPTSFWILYNE